MDGWTIITLPTLSLSKSRHRIDIIADWAVANKIDFDTVGISSRIVRFKKQADATFFKLSFHWAEQHNITELEFQ